MEPDIMQLFMSGGANFAFGVFLYMQNKDLQKRADAREAKQEQKEEELRQRYDTVIKDLQAKEETMRKELVKEVTDMDKQLSLLEQKVDMVSTIVQEIKAKFVRVSNAK
jgi:uncharacterized protein HemX